MNGKALAAAGISLALMGAAVFLVLHRDPKSGGVHSPELDRGLVGYWPFDEGEGSVAHDSSGAERHGRISGSGSGIWTPGRVGSASIHFSAAAPDRRVDFGAHSFGPLDGVTIAFWIRTSSKGRFTIFSRPPIFFKEQGELWVGFAQTTMLARSIADGAWHHVALRIDAKEQYKVALDGESVIEVTSSSGKTPPWDDWTWTLGPAPGFEGSVDDLRIYSRLLGEAEIRTLAGLK